MGRYNLKRIKKIFWLKLGKNFPCTGQQRVRFIKMGGVNVGDLKTTFIGNNVTFDTLRPDLITIGNHVHITAGCVILTHYIDTDAKSTSYKYGSVTFDDECFIGTNTIICKSVKIGKHAFVGAGSVVTKDIPDNEIWAGNPAKFIRKR